VGSPAPQRLRAVLGHVGYRGSMTRIGTMARSSVEDLERNRFRLNRLSLKWIKARVSQQKTPGIARGLEPLRMQNSASSLNAYSSEWRPSCARLQEVSNSASHLRKLQSSCPSAR
jgi:hypothetical protein